MGHIANGPLAQPSAAQTEYVAVRGWGRGWEGGGGGSDDGEGGKGEGEGEGGGGREGQREGGEEEVQGKNRQERWKVG